MPIATSPKLKVAIVGAGPGGLATTIQFRRLDNVEVQVFDQARELREVGAGISINDNTWRLLQDLEAADALEQFTSRSEKGVVDSQHRNGRTGELLAESVHTGHTDKPPRSRIERYKLQNALLSRLPKGLIQLSKKLASIAETDKGVFLTFTDSITAGPFDLVVGADGIRSAVRQHIFPDHHLSYTGKVAYRVLIPQEKVAHIPDVPKASVFWHTPTTHVYTCPLDNGLFEIATRAIEDEEYGSKVSWGRTVTKDRVVPHYEGYCDTIRAVIDAPDEWLEFAIFGGPRLLGSVTSNGRIVLIGDAAHPLSGAFGSGAAFAFEDAYILKHALEYAQEKGKSTTYALDLFDSIRSPRYEGLYEVLDRGLDNVKDVKSQTLPPDEHVSEVIKRNWKGGEEGGWIYGYNIKDVWAERKAVEDAKLAKVPLPTVSHAEQVATVTVSA